MKAAGMVTIQEEIVGLNGYMELMEYWWPSVKDSVHSHSVERPKESCSSFIATGSMTAVGKIDLRLAETFEADHYDAYLETINPGQRSLCVHWELDPQLYDSYIPYSPEGTLNGKVVDAQMAKQMSFVARWGSACGTPFDASAFLVKHPQFGWMNGLLKDRPTRPWTIFKAEETK